MHTFAIAAALVGLVGLAPVAASAASKTYDLGAFTELDISSGIDAVVTVGGPFSVSAESANQAVLDDMTVVVSGGRLKAYFEWSLLDFMMPERHVTLTITLPELTAADASAGADVRIAGPTSPAGFKGNSSSGADLRVSGAASRSYSLNASSGARIDIAGTCVDAKLNASSGARIDAGNLACESIDANGSSGAQIAAQATVALKGNASSGAGIRVRGNPARVDRNESSGGRISLD